MFNEETIEKIWKLALTVEGFNPDIIRKDACGAWIMKTNMATGILSLAGKLTMCTLCQWAGLMT